MIFNNYLAKLKQIPLEGEDESFAGGRAGEPEEISPTLQVQDFEEFFIFSVINWIFVII